jgi:hypothetical protein
MLLHHNLSFTGYEDHQFGLQGLFVYPPKKFAFCLIEKNACSLWIETVLQELLHGASDIPQRPNLIQHSGVSRAPQIPKELTGVNYQISHESQHYFGTKGLDDVFQDPSATRAVFVREPLERFASAFMNKCIGIDVLNCPSRSKVFRNMVEWALSRDMNHVGGHWQPQAYHCELYKRVSGYNVIGLMGENLDDDMNCVLAKAGLHNFTRKPKPRVNHESNSLNTTAVLQRLFTPAAARLLVQKLQADYALFGFPNPPAWVAGATGEWYNREPVSATSSIQQDANQTEFDRSWEDGDTDDLVELAFRMGYVS